MVGENWGTRSPTHTMDRVRRVTSACDNCRKKKVRCDGPYMSNNRCSVCLVSNVGCTYSVVARKRAVKEYTTILENRLSKVENLLRTHRPDIDISRELSKSEKLLRQEPTEVELSVMSNSTEVKTIAPELYQDGDGADSSDYESAMIDSLDEIHNVKFKNEKATFFGKSSSVGLFRRVMYMKTGSSSIGSNCERLLLRRRPEFWQPDPFAETMVRSPKPNYRYPDPELLSYLVDFYFTEVHIYMPFLHRSTFEQAILDGLHLRDEGFGTVLLLVCAIASSQSRNPAPDSGMGKQNASFWFYQVRMDRRPILGPVTLYDAQTIFLSAIYTWIVCPPDGAWLMIGVGTRLCQDVGAHRRKFYGARPTVEGEQWKRMFWAFLTFERYLSCSFGRQCSLREEDLDLDYPAECDDEYWLHPDPDKAFKQPPGKPCTVSYFISVVKQSRILGKVLRTLYSSNKSKVLLNILDPEKEKILVAELDSALNKWVDSVPTHLKWDPDREDSVFARQSAHLWANYYHLQILVHRPFINPARKSSPSNFPSLAICTNAARLCSKVAEALSIKYGGMTCHLMLPVFISGVVLLVNMWGSVEARQNNDQEKDAVAFIRCIEAIKDTENIFRPSAHLRRVLESLATIGELPDKSFFPTSPRTMERVSDGSTPQKDEHCVGEENQMRVDREMTSRPFPSVMFGWCDSAGGDRLDGHPQLHGISHHHGGSPKKSPLELSPGKLAEFVQVPRLPPVSRDASMFPSIEGHSVQAHPRIPNHLVAAPNLAMYEEMMSNFGSVFADRPQEGNFTNVDNGLTSMASSLTSYSHSVTDSLASRVRLDLPEMSVADTNTFALMSAAPTSTLWEDWDTYFCDVINGMPGARIATDS